MSSYDVYIDEIADFAIGSFEISRAKRMAFELSFGMHQIPIHVMFSGQNHTEKVDSAFGQRSAAESWIWVPRGPFWALLATGALGKAQESGIDFLEMNSLQAGL